MRKGLTQRQSAGRRDGRRDSGAATKIADFSLILLYGGGSDIEKKRSGVWAAVRLCTDLVWHRALYLPFLPRRNACKASRRIAAVRNRFATGTPHTLPHTHTLVCVSGHDTGLKCMNHSHAIALWDQARLERGWCTSLR